MLTEEVSITWKHIYMQKTEKKASKKQLVEHLNILSGDKNFTAYEIKLWQEKTNAFFYLRHFKPITFTKNKYDKL